MRRIIAEGCGDIATRSTEMERGRLRMCSEYQAIRHSGHEEKHAFITSGSCH